MRCAFVLLFAIATQAATLTLHPPVIYDCSGPVGKASLEWIGATGPVTVIIGPQRIPMTGLEGPSGSAETGLWVSDGLEFRLLSTSGAVEALAIAKVQCNAGNAAANGIVGTSFFPLEVGNTWVYKTDSRFATSSYVIWKVTGLREQSSHVYAEISAVRSTGSNAILLLREDPDGTLWQLAGTPEKPVEQVYLKPSDARHAAFTSAVGSFPDAATQNLDTVLSREEKVFVRGVGLTRDRLTLGGGSNGGFGESLDLIEYHLASGPRVQVQSPRVSVTAESAVLDVTGKLVTNCAIPCYYAACGIGSPVDPPNTYKPCTRTRIEASAEAGFWGEVALLNAGGQTVFSSGQMASPPGELLQYVQVPLYSAPNKPLPAGTYRLVGHVGQGDVETATSLITIELR